MQVVSTPYSGFYPSIGAWCSMIATPFSTAYVATSNSELSQDLTTTIATSGLNEIEVLDQPHSVRVHNAIYQQVQTNPAPGQYSYLKASNRIIVNIATGHSGHQVICENTAPISVSWFGSSFALTPFEHHNTPLFDRVPISELGQDFYNFLVDINAGHSSELTLSYNHSKGELPTASIAIEVVNDELEATIDKLEETLNSNQIHLIYGTPFFLKPFSISINENSNTSEIDLSFESIYAVRGEYNPLDYYIYVNQGSSSVPFVSLASSSGASVEGSNQVVATRNSDSKERKQIRSLLEALASSQSSFLDYSKISAVQITRNGTSRRHILPNNFSINPEIKITRNGVIGAPIVDGVRLSSPWVYKAYAPDTSGLTIKDEIAANSDTEDENIKVDEQRTIGDPDLQPDTPNKILDGGSYLYISTEEPDNFPQMAQNPNTVVYPSGFKKSKWTQINESGFNAGQINGEEWGWQLDSSQVWSYYDEPVLNPKYATDPSQPQFLYFQNDPIWKYTMPVYSAHWKKCRTWSLQVGFDALGYPTLEQEIGIKWIQPKSEGDNRTAAQLLYDADKLEYEANVLRIEASALAINSPSWVQKTNEANSKDESAAAKRKDAALYKFRELPYIRTTRKFYRKLSLDRAEIQEDEQSQPCDKDKRDTASPVTPPAYFLERELTEENSLTTIPSPYTGETPIVIGETYERRYWTVVSPAGYQTFESVKSSSQQSGDTTNLSVGEWRTGTPEPAARKPVILPQRAKKKPDKKPKSQYTTFLSTNGGSPIPFSAASRPTVSLEGVNDLSVAYPALLEMARQENLSSETTTSDSPWYRIIKPGETAFWLGKLWQCTAISRVDKLGYGGLIQCQSYQCDWGSYLTGLTLSATTISNCALEQ